MGTEWVGVRGEGSVGDKQIFDCVRARSVNEPGGPRKSHGALGGTGHESLDHGARG